MRTLLRIAAIGVWTVAGFGLSIVLIYFGLLFLVYCSKQYNWQLLHWMPEWLFWTLLLATMTIFTGTPAVLGLFGLLPGTGDRRVRSRPARFPIKVNQPTR